MITADDVRAIPLFAALEDDQAAFIAAAAADLHLHAGDWFASEGETPAFFALIDGRFEVVKRYGDDLRQLAVREPGEFMGEIPIVLGGPFIAGARTLEPSRLLRLEARDFRHVLNTARCVRDEIVAVIGRRIEGLEEEVANETPPPVVVGSSRDAGCHEIREFLARNRRAFEWFDPADGRACQAGGNVDPVDMPMVILAGGRRLVRPSLCELADAVGLRTKPEHDAYDVVVIGGGPAGLAAAVYGASEGLRTLLFDRLATGGQAGTSSRIENYLGFPSGLSGDELAARAEAQAERFGAEIVVARDVLRIDAGAPCHRVVFEASTPSGSASIETHAIVLATGVSYRKLAVPDIERFLGAGVYYGAARTEARGMRGRNLILVGGGNSAGQAAMFFSNYAANVTLLIRGADLRASMSQYLIDQLATKENIAVRAHGEIVAVDGNDRLEGVTIRDGRNGETQREPIDAIFVFIGADAMTEWLPQDVVRDARGYVCTGRDVVDLVGEHRPWPHDRDPYLLETSVPGIFAAGDVRHGSIKRVAAGVGEGSMSIAFVHEYLAEEAVVIA
jgi:thioredoxin reductase (NADPH)